MNNNLIFKATKIKKTNKNISNEDIISDFFLSIKPNESMGFLFTNNEIKNNLIKILSGEDKDYYGFFQFKNEFYFKNSNSISLKSIVSLNNWNWFDSMNNNWKWKNIFINLINDNNSKYVNKIYDQINSLNNLQKKEIIFETIKVKIDSIDDINREIDKIIWDTREFIDKLQYEIKNKNDTKIEKIYYEFITAYKKYLKNRIFLVNKRNQKMMDIIFNIEANKIKNINNNLDLIKLQSLKNEIKFIEDNLKNKRDKNFLKKQKKKLKDDLHNMYKKNENFLLILKNNFILLNKQHIKSSKEKKQNVNSFLLLLNKTMIKIFNINTFNKLAYLNNEEINNFRNQIESFYYSSLYSLKLMNENEKIRHVKYQLVEDLNIIIENYEKISLTNLNDINVKFNEEIDFIIKNFNKHYPKWDIESKKIELQNLIDDIEWNDNILIANINKKIELLNEKSQIKFNKYNELSKKIYKELIHFFKLKNGYINTSSKNNYSSLSDKIFTSKMSQYKSLYNKQKDDSKKINNLLIGAKKNSDKSYFNSNKQLIKKYMMYNKAKELNIDFFDLEERINDSNSILKAKMLLLKPLIEMKEIVILDDCFSIIKNHSNTDTHEMEIIYENTFKHQNMIWLIFDQNINEIKNHVDNVCIFKNSRIIEFGNINKIMRNPIYSETYKLLNLNKNKKQNVINSEDFKNQNDYDYYKLDGGHYVFGNISTLYQKTKFVPQLSEWTNNKIKFEEFENEIQFKSNLENIEANNEKIDDEEKETIIIDVRKINKKNKSSNK